MDPDRNRERGGTGNGADVAAALIKWAAIVVVVLIVAYVVLQILDTVRGVAL